MRRLTILGSGAAMGVPALGNGWNACNPTNPKNIRLRSGTYLEINNIKFLIDTSPDLRQQLINANIRDIDAVFYTHTHADHLHGIDDLREINRITNKAIELYASKDNLKIIRTRFPYLIAEDVNNIEPIYRAALHPNTFEYNQSFYYKDLKITPIKLIGHNVENSGYIFNDGEVVHISDCREIPDEAFEQIKRQPEVLIVPLTTPRGTRFHIGLDGVLEYIEKINPKRAIINHMAVECDYKKIYSNCPSNAEPAYDGLSITW